MSLFEPLVCGDLLNPAPFDSSYTPAVRREIYISIRNDGVIGNGTITDPFNGATPELLDQLLRDSSKVTTEMTIYFGPGQFQTRGQGFNRGIGIGFEVQRGQHFIGAGIDKTILQLIDVEPNDPNLIATGAVFTTLLPVSDIVVQDMTIDVNSLRQPREDGTFNPEKNQEKPA